jgi:hypothetical protein
MATSGSASWTLTRSQVITGALRKLAVLPSGGAPTTAQTSDAVDALQAIVKAFQVDGMPLWAIVSKTFTATTNVASYTIGPGATVATLGMPLKVIQAWYTPSGGNNTPMEVIPRYDYNQLPRSAADVGTPIQLYYQPGITTGTISLWPIPNNSTTTISVDYTTPYEDMNNATDTFTFPSYWMQALIYNLAWSLSPEYGIPINDRNQLAGEAKYWHQEALSYGSEEGSFY